MLQVREQSSMNLIFSTHLLNPETQYIIFKLPISDKGLHQKIADDTHRKHSEDSLPEASRAIYKHTHKLSAEGTANRNT